MKNRKSNFVSAILDAVSVSANDDPCNGTEREKKLCRPSEIPIYTNQCVCREHREENHRPSALERLIIYARHKAEDFSEEMEHYKGEGSIQYNRGKKHFDNFLYYLREEENVLPRVGAIATGGLIGFLCGIRGRYLKRTIYATTGALGVAAICYPEEAAEYTKVVVTQAKNIIITAYDLIKNDKKVEVKNENNNNGADSENSGNDTPTVEDPLAIIARTRDLAINKQCHCPIGACLGHQEESNDTK
uniref:MICOS complex subunit n=1 Tax=Diabrotica virgifera virgifera TaxID=50390 RepID=A0A6P7F996_DIAVI